MVCKLQYEKKIITFSVDYRTESHIKGEVVKYQSIPHRDAAEIGETDLPRKGWKSITVSEDVYDYFWKEWQENKNEHKLKEGITSFSGFLTKILYELIQRETEGEGTR